MKNYSLLLFPFFFSILFQDRILKEQVVGHDINAITIYLNSAEIHRKAEVNIPKGKSDIILKGISSRMKNEGMKIRLSDGVRVYAVNAEDNPGAVRESKDWNYATAQLARLEEEKGLLDISEKTIYSELDYWEANMKIGGDRGATFSELDQGAKYFTDKVQSLEAKLYSIKEQKAELDQRIFEWDNKLEQFTLEAEKRSKQIRITILSDQAVTADLDVRYLVSHAVWSPYYSLRATDKSQPIILDYQAQIYNDTGNDWDNKPITLAILDPSEDVSQPRLDAWVLDNGYGTANQEGKLSDAKGRYYGKSDASQQFNVLQVDDLSTRFEIKDKHFIPSDATPHMIDVTSYTKEADYYTLSIPKVKDGAFLIARIKDWESLGLLDGPMNLYYKEAYQGVSRLDTRQVSDTLDISLGKENSYTITRRKESSMSSKKLLGSTIKEVLTYEIIVRNNKNQTAEIEVRDQLPVSTDKNVEVRPLVISGAKVDVLSGQLTWNIKLEANESRRIPFKFSVKYPKGKRGLLKYNSREIISPRYF